MKGLRIKAKAAVCDIKQFYYNNSGFSSEGGEVVVGDTTITFHRFYGSPKGTDLTWALKQARKLGATKITNSSGYRWFVKNLGKDHGFYNNL